MTKCNKKKTTILLLLMVIVISSAIFAGCGEPDSIEVTYMVDSGVYATESYSSFEDISLPTSPQKEGYNFIGWYTTETFDAGTLFSKSDFLDSKTISLALYARFAAIEFEAFIDGEVYGDITALNAYTEMPEKEGLTFDGWYIDENYQTKYASQDIYQIYGRFMAEVVFDNGHEIVYSTLVSPGAKVAEPTYSQFGKHYMSESNYYFTTGEIGKVESLNKFDFNATVIQENYSINIVWATEELTYKTSDSGNIYIDGPGYGTNGSTDLEVVSVPSFIDGKKVESVTKLTNIHAKKLIINYNVEAVEEVWYTTILVSAQIEEIIFPDSLKIISDSFVLEGEPNAVTIPNGVEVIVSSFRLGIYEYKGYSYNIEVPDSVTFMAQVPTNFSFSNNSAYYIKDSSIYKDYEGGTYLVSLGATDPTHLVVPEGLDGITAGAITFFSKYAKYVELPSTFSGVEVYSFEKVDYPLHEYTDGTKTTTIFNVLNNGVLESFIVDNSSWDESLDMSITGGSTGYKDFLDSYKVVFVAEVEVGEDVTININAVNKFISSESGTAKVTVQSGQELTVDDILKKIEILGVSIYDMVDSGIYELISLMQFGNDLFSEEETTLTIKNNLYLNIEYGITKTGVTFELSDDETYYIVTGFSGALNAVEIGETGTYMIIIPTMYNDLPVKTIKESAFENNQFIGSAIIASSVTRIEEKAFYGATNLTTVEIGGVEGVTETINGQDVIGTIGTIEYIGTSAFENSGIKSFTMGLESMKTIEPYAFKNEFLEKFLNIDATSTYKGRLVGGKLTGYSYRSDLVIGRYYYGYSNNQTDESAWNIMVYTGSTNEKISYAVETTPEKYHDVIDVQIVATAGASTYGYNSAYFYIGQSEVSSAMSMQLAIRAEILEGSFYYTKAVASSYICLVNIKKIHKNAFTNMNSNFEDTSISSNFKIYYSTDYYIDIEEVNALATADYFTTYPNGIFEDGWWEGVMSTDSDYSNRMAFTADIVTLKPMAIM